MLILCEEACHDHGGLESLLRLTRQDTDQRLVVVSEWIRDFEAEHRETAYG